MRLRYVDHGHVHTYIPYRWAARTVHPDLPNAVSQSAVIAVGIANGQGGNAGIVVEDTPAAIPDRLPGPNGFNLADNGS